MARRDDSDHDRVAFRTVVAVDPKALDVNQKSQRLWLAAKAVCDLQPDLKEIWDAPESQVDIGGVPATDLHEVMFRLVRRIVTKEAHGDGRGDTQLHAIATLVLLAIKWHADESGVGLDMAGIKPDKLTRS